MRFRGDVEGLRAVAVLLVVLDHLEVPGFGGGFVGVDVFFVVSGYLITSLLASEYAKKAEAPGGRGSISIPAFYARRARRILPAALTVIVAVVVAGGVLLNEFRIAQIRHDAIWALFFASNVNFIQQTTDYFTQGLVDSSPFQHYWSLAVEEQFYLVWPALFLLVTRIPGTTLFGVSVRWRARVAMAVCAIGAASLAWSIVATARGPAGAYFSTFTRAWELALGALIGITTTRATRLPRGLARAASAAGVGLFVAACAFIGATTPFPGAAALLPTLATALLIVGGITERIPLPNRALCFRPLRFLGRISYSIYLWHWPLVVFAAALYPTLSKTTQMRLLILLITLAVSTLSFYLVEQPGRRIGVEGRRDRVVPGRRWKGRNLVTATLGACVLAAVFVGLASAIDPERSTVIPVQMGSSSQPAADSSFALGGERPPAGMTAYVKTLRAWQRKIRAGLAVRSLPKSLRPLGSHLVHYVEPYCNPNLAGVVRGECVVGRIRSPRHVAILTGDSHAGMFEIAVMRALGRRTWRLHIFQRGHCGWAGSVGPRLPVSASECRVDQTQTLARIRALHPDLIVLSEADVTTPYRTRSEMASSLAAFLRTGARVVVLGHTPAVPSFDVCLSGSGDISGCVGALPTTYFSARSLERSLATRARATFVDTSAWFCVPVKGRTLCPAVIDGAPAWRDGTHITSDLEPKLVPVMRAILGPLEISTKPPRPAKKTTYAKALRAWQRKVGAGLSLRQLPESLRPLSPHLSKSFPLRCGRGVMPEECVVGNRAAAHVAVLLGDSHAEMFRNSVWRSFDRTTWRIHIFVKYACGWAGAVDGSVSAADCARFQRSALQRIRRLRPDVLLLSEHLVVTPFRSPAAMASSLAALTRTARRTIVIGHTPLPRPWTTCLMGSDISRCFVVLDRTFWSDVTVERELSLHARALFVDTSAWLCARSAAQTVCPPVIDGVPAFKDTTHISAELQLKLVPVVRALLLSVGVPASGGAS